MCKEVTVDLALHDEDDLRVAPQGEWSQREVSNLPYTDSKSVDSANVVYAEIKVVSVSHVSFSRPQVWVPRGAGQRYESEIDLKMVDTCGIRTRNHWVQTSCDPVSLMTHRDGPTRGCRTRPCGGFESPASASVG